MKIHVFIKPEDVEVIKKIGGEIRFHTTRDYFTQDSVNVTFNVDSAYIISTKGRKNFIKFAGYESD